MYNGGGMGDESLRTSAWEAKDREHQVLLGLKQLLLIFVMHLGGLGRQVRNPTPHLHFTGICLE